MKKSAVLILCALLASSCLHGAEVSKVDPQHVAMIESLREKARKDDVDAMLLLVEMVTDMAPRYEEEAEFWLRRAAVLGNKEAPRMLAEMLLLRNDEGGFEEAIVIFKSIYEPGDFQLARRIARAYKNNDRIEESVGWFQIAAVGGDFSSAVDLSDIYADVDRIQSEEISSFWACKAISLRDDGSFIIEKLRDRVKRYEKVCPSR